MTDQKLLLVVCGWPLSGKGTIAEHLSKRLGIHYIDIDKVRFINFGLPDPHPGLSEEAMAKDRKEMTASYQLLLHATDIHLDLERSLVIGATFSRSSYWKALSSVVETHPSVRMRIVWCRPQNDTDEEIRHRLSGRTFGVNCWSSVNSIERYNEVKARYHPLELPHLKVDTSPPRTVAECVDEALTYALS